MKLQYVRQMFWTHLKYLNSAGILTFYRSLGWVCIFLDECVNETWFWWHKNMLYYVTSSPVIVFLTLLWPGILHSLQKWLYSMISDFDHFPRRSFLYFAKKGATHSIFKTNGWFFTCMGEKYLILQSSLIE